VGYQPERVIFCHTKISYGRSVPHLSGRFWLSYF